MTTLAPSAEIPRAIAAPIPDPPPVMTTVLPVNLSLTITCSFAVPALALRV
jgi:hypothetical protein